MLSLHAQSYSVCPSAGFYFTSVDDYTANAEALKESHSLEEFAIQFIDGDDFACSLASAMKIDQGSIASFFETLEALEHAEEHEKAAFLYLVEDLGYDPEPALETYEDVMLSEEKPEDLAHGYAEDCMGLEGFALQYFNAEAFARDCLLGGDWAETKVGGKDYVVTNTSEF